MSGRFEAYENTPIGQKLMAIIDVPERIPAFCMMSAIGKPAVQVVASAVSEVIDALPSKADRDAAGQFCGWAVARIMRQLGYRLRQERGRVNNASFKTGAVWEDAGIEVRVGRSLPPGVTRRIDLRVKRSKAGETIGTWEALQTASNPTRRLRIVVEAEKPIDEALHNAKAYAREWKFGFLMIHDPSGLLSAAWPEGAG